MKVHHIRDLSLFILLLVFSFLIVLQSGFTGFGLDQGMMFSVGWKFATGFYPLVDMPQAHGSTTAALTGLAFSLFGASWKTYVSTASITNVVFTATVFALLRHQGLNLPLSLMYSAGSAVLFAPPHAVPNYDQGSFLFSLVMIYFIIKGNDSNRSYIYYFSSFMMGVLAFFSKQIPFAYFTPLILFLLFIVPPGRRQAAFWGIFCGMAVSLAFLGWIMSISRFSFDEFIYYSIKMPLLLGKERSGNFSIIPFINLFNIGSITYVVLSFFSLAVIWIRRRNIMETLGARQFISLACGLTFYFITFVFARTTHNVIDQGIPLIFVGTGLIHAALSKILAARVNRFVTMTLVVLTVVDCTRFHLTSNLRHKVHGPFDFSVPADHRLSDSIPALAGLRWAQPVVKTITASDILERYTFLTTISKNVIELDYLGYGSSPAMVAAGVRDRVPSQYIQYDHSIPKLSTPEGQNFVQIFYSTLAENQLEWVISRQIPDDPKQLFSKPIIDRLQCEQRNFPNFVAVRICPGKLKQELEWIYSYYKDVAGRG